MFGTLVIALCVLECGQGPEINADQFTEIVQKQSESLKTVVFVYRGAARWIGPLNHGVTPLRFDDDFQGVFLYRNDEAGLLDVYMKMKKPGALPVRKKRSVLKGQSERIRGIEKGKIWIDPAKDIEVGPGTITSLNDISGTQSLFRPPCLWKQLGDLKSRHYVFEGWEEVDGRNCLRFQIDTYRNATQHNLDYERFWIDVDRNAQIVRRELYKGGKLTTRIDVSLIQVPDKNSKSIWFPRVSQTLGYVWNDEIHPTAVYVQTVEVVPNSIRANVAIPDELLTVRRTSTLPATGELADIEVIFSLSELRREFENPPMPQR